MSRAEIADELEHLRRAHESARDRIQDLLWSRHHRIRDNRASRAAKATDPDYAEMLDHDRAATALNLAIRAVAP